MGYELRRPEADLLRNGIHELRVRCQRVHYRFLYFFHQGAAVIVHGIQKENEVLDAEIERAIRRRERFEADPTAHTFVE